MRRCSLMLGASLLTSVFVLVGFSSDARSTTTARVACAHTLTPGFLGYEVLDPDGWTTEEEAELEKVLDRFSRQVCPAPEFISVVGSSFRARHIDDEREWQDTFQIKASPPENEGIPESHWPTYKVIADMPSLIRMSIAIRSTHGKLLYRTGMVNLPDEHQ